MARRFARPTRRGGPARPVARIGTLARRSAGFSAAAGRSIVARRNLDTAAPVPTSGLPVRLDPRLWGAVEVPDRRRSAGLSGDPAMDRLRRLTGGRRPAPSAGLPPRGLPRALARRHDSAAGRSTGPAGVARRLRPSTAAVASEPAVRAAGDGGRKGRRTLPPGVADPSRSPIAAALAGRTADPGRAARPAEAPVRRLGADRGRAARPERSSSRPTPTRPDPGRLAALDRGTGSTGQPAAPHRPAAPGAAPGSGATGASGPAAGDGRTGGTGADGSPAARPGPSGPGAPLGRTARGDGRRGPAAGERRTDGTSDRRGQDAGTGSTATGGEGGPNGGTAPGPGATGASGPATEAPPALRRGTPHPAYLLQRRFGPAGAGALARARATEALGAGGTTVPLPSVARGPVAGPRVGTAPLARLVAPSPDPARSGAATGTPRRTAGPDRRAGRGGHEPVAAGAERPRPTTAARSTDAPRAGAPTTGAPATHTTDATTDVRRRLAAALGRSPVATGAGSSVPGGRRGSGTGAAAATGAAAVIRRLAAAGASGSPAGPRLAGHLPVRPAPGARADDRPAATGASGTAATGPARPFTSPLSTRVRRSTAAARHAGVGPVAPGAAARATGAAPRAPTSLRRLAVVPDRPARPTPVAGAAVRPAVATPR
ncbi:MAG: hypothetical protein AB7L84_03870, partial [Acidimicrobiia bacterium]